MRNNWFKFFSFFLDTWMYQITKTIHSLHYELSQNLDVSKRKNQDEFRFYIEDDKTFEEYIETMTKEGIWGGQLELKALADSLKFNVIIHEYWKIFGEEKGIFTEIKMPNNKKVGIVDYYNTIFVNEVKNY